MENDAISNATRSERIEARTTPKVLAMLRHAAAMQAIEEAQVIRLSAEDQRRFVDALLDPPEPTPAMTRAHAHRQRLVREP